VRTTADYAECRNDLLRFCLRYLGQVADAEDVVQDVAVKLSEQTEIESPRAWMFRAARNRCLNILRQRRDPGTLFAESKFPSPWTGPRTAVNRDERNNRIRAAITAMPRDLGEVLTLRYLEGFGRKETAEILERSETEVKVQLGRARHELARKLKETEFGK